MTIDMMNFRNLLEKTPDADLLRKMIGFVAERLMELEVGAVTGAAYGEKDPARRAQRNGYRDGDWETRAGIRKPLDTPALVSAGNLGYGSAGIRSAERGRKVVFMENIPFNRPSLVGREFQYLEDALARGQLSGDGYFTRLCNARIVELSGAPVALLTHSCTAALEMAAILCDLVPGDEVIMPSFTFVSTANAVVLRGAVPVFVDIDPDTLNINPDAVAAAVTPRTRAIFAVHYAGFPADMDALTKIAAAHGLMLVEDAAQALGSTYKGKPAGSLGDMAAFSFHETKNIISGEGGALTLSRADLAERAEIIREKGTNRSRFLRGQVDKYTWVDVGSSFLPGELVSAFLYGQLEQEAKIRQMRLALFDRYAEAFNDLGAQGRVALPKVPPDTTGNGHMFYLMLDDIDDRDAFIGHLRSHGINAPFHYVPLHSAPAGQRLARAEGDMSVTNATHARLVRLPLYYTLGDGIERVIDVSRAWLGANSRV